MFKPRTHLSDEELRDLYLAQGLTMTEIAARLNVGESTIRRKLAVLGITSRARGPKGSRLLPHQELTESLLRQLYLEEKLSIPQIAEQYGWGRETIRLRLIEYNIPIRTFSQAHLVQHNTWHEYHDFSGDPIEKAYMLGFRLGDLNVRREHVSSEVLRLSCSSTRIEQINLIQRLFQPYGHVNINRKLKLAINGMVEHGITCSVNQSFEFLLDYSSNVPGWILNDDTIFLSFFAGLADAEGSFHLITHTNRLPVGKFGIKNTDKALLEQCHTKLWLLGIRCSSITKVYDAGHQTSKRGVFATKTLWAFNIENKESVLLLIQRLAPFLKHEKRRADMARVRENVEWRNSVEFKNQAAEKRAQSARRTNEAKKQNRN